MAASREKRRGRQASAGFWIAVRAAAWLPFETLGSPPTRLWLLAKQAMEPRRARRPARRQADRLSSLALKHTTRAGESSGSFARYCTYDALPAVCLAVVWYHSMSATKTMAALIGVYLCYMHTPSGRAFFGPLRVLLVGLGFRLGSVPFRVGLWFGGRPVLGVSSFVTAVVDI